MDDGAYQYRRFLSGDDEGIVEIIRIYKDGLILFINGYVRNIHIAEELAEDTFFKLLVKKPRYSDRYCFKTWLYTIGRNLALDHLKREAKKVDISDEDLVLLQREEKSVEQQYFVKEERIRLHRAILQLTPRYGEIIYLAYFELLSNQDIGRIIHRTPKQVANLLYRAKDALKSILIKEGFEYEGL